MKQRRRLYLFKEDSLKVDLDLRLSMGDVENAIQALKSNDIKELRQSFQLLAARANFSFDKFDKLKLTPVTPKEQAMLFSREFELINHETHYLDFLRVFKEFDGTTDRHERIIFSVMSNVWYAMITHVDTNGDVVLEEMISEKKDLKQVLLSIMESSDRARTQATS